MRHNLTFDNPDAMRPDELREHVRMLRHARQREPDEDGRRHIDCVISYCRLMAEAWEEREQGRAGMALALERVAERFYERLPAYLRW